MRKLAFLFMTAVALPSVLLAGLALRALRDQRLVLERQQTLLAESRAAELARAVESEMDAVLAGFAATTDALVSGSPPGTLDHRFDDAIRERATNVAVGFAVNLVGVCFAPAPLGRPEAIRFRLENDRFLGNIESVEVTWNSPKGRINVDEVLRGARTKTDGVFASTPGAGGARPARTFREIIGDATSGTVARFVQDDLELLVWRKVPSRPAVIYGAQLDPAALRHRLAGVVVQASGPDARLVALLRDDSQRVVASTRPGFADAARRPLAAADIGDKLPHWHVAVFEAEPGRLDAAASATRLTLALMVGLLLLAIAVGSWLISADLRRQLRLARQKAGFVSNVSHELRTPLTSIRMFAELLASEPDAPRERRERFLSVIGAETRRLSRLVDNVLDFGRLERGEVPWKARPVDLAAAARAAAESVGPQLAAAGVVLSLEMPPGPVTVDGDADALAQVFSNLLSNAAKYAASGRVAVLRVRRGPGVAEAEVEDRGPGLPRGAAERIFEEFYRGEDSLAAGIPGCGLGLALARRIVAAHGGTLAARDRAGGGAVFALRIPTREDAP